MKFIENTRKAYTEWVASHDNKYFQTWTYQEGTSDRLVGTTFTEGMHRINQKVHGRRYCKRNRFIEGFVIRERQKNGTLHHHCLLHENKFKLPDFEEMRSIFLNTCLKLHVPGKPNKKLISLQGCDFQPYYNSDGSNKLEWYITKTLGSRNRIPEGLHDNLAPLSVEGALFGLRPLQLH